MHQKEPNSFILKMITGIAVFVVFILFMYYRSANTSKDIVDFMLREYQEHRAEISELKEMSNSFNCPDYYYFTYTKSGMYSYLYCDSSSFRKDILLTSQTQSYLSDKSINTVMFSHNNVWIDYKKRDYGLNNYYLVYVGNRDYLISSGNKVIQDIGNGWYVVLAQF